MTALFDNFIVDNIYRVESMGVAGIYYMAKCTEKVCKVYDIYSKYEMPNIWKSVNLQDLCKRSFCSYQYLDEYKNYFYKMVEINSHRRPKVDDGVDTEASDRSSYPSLAKNNIMPNQIIGKSLCIMINIVQLVAYISSSIIMGSCFECPIIFSFFVVFLSKIINNILIESKSLEENKKIYLFINLFKYSFIQVMYLFIMIMAIRESLVAVYDYYVLSLFVCSFCCLFYLLLCWSDAQASKKQMKASE